MLKGIKKFIKSKLRPKKSPFARWLYRWLYMKYDDIKCFRHRHMTYTQIEAEIGRRYQSVFGRPLDWDNPKTYTEKLNVAKIYMPTPLKTKLADKVAAREWIAENIGSEYLVPLLGVYGSFDEIDFDALPEQFVIKCNHDCGSVTLVKDKGKIDRDALRKKYARCMRRNWAWMNLEMHYREITPKIMVEQFIGDSINEYKFYCFNGKPCYCFTTFGQRHVNLTINFYDMNWQVAAFTRPDHKAHINLVERPAKYNEMKAIASKLCEGFEHVRVDLYVAGGNIYNGEMTFTTAGGFGRLSPDEWDYRLGDLWPFDTSIRRKVLAEHSRP
ncbi:MAG: hypothetical protein IJG65_05170 [Synergistaceae bacterium]|nr:hypothetical protein [Synergistaceae bacterium]